jgi:hypothetical protein
VALISQPTKAAERSTMLAIGTVLAELVAATDSRLRLPELRGAGVKGVKGVNAPGRTIY